MQKYCDNMGCDLDQCLVLRNGTPLVTIWDPQAKGYVPLIDIEDGDVISVGTVRAPKLTGCLPYTTIVDRDNERQSARNERLWWGEEIQTSSTRAALGPGLPEAPVVYDPDIIEVTVKRLRVLVGNLTTFSPR